MPLPGSFLKASLLLSLGRDHLVGWDGPFGTDPGLIPSRSSSEGAERARVETVS